MHNNEIENKVKQAFKNATPNVLDSVLSDCQNQKGRVIIMEERKKMSTKMKVLVNIAAVLVIVIAAAAGFHAYNMNYAIASTISLDVNPSVEIKVNEKEEVLDVTAKNEDGQIIIGDMDFKGNDLEVTVNALIGSMLKNGYLSEIANSILISVDNNDPAQSAALQEKLAAEINELLQANSFNGAVLCQSVNADANLQELANTYGITLGKAQLIQQITNNNSLYTFEELVPLSINELNLISNSGKNQLENISSVGTASEKAYIGETKAKQIALSHAGVSESSVYEIEMEMGYERGTMVYEIDFKANNYEYEYDINASSGEIVKSQKHKDDDAQYFGNNGNGNSNSNNNSNSGSYIGEDKAKQIALNHAGVNSSNIYDYEISRDNERGTIIYEIDFKANNYEYSYDIDATTGKILKNEKEYDD